MQPLTFINCMVLQSFIKKVVKSSNLLLFNCGHYLKLSSSRLAISMTNLIVQNLQLHTKNICTSLGFCFNSSTICTKFNVQIGAGRHLKGFGLASLSGARHAYMPPRLKTKQLWALYCNKYIVMITTRKAGFFLLLYCDNEQGKFTTGKVQSFLS